MAAEFATGGQIAFQPGLGASHRMVGSEYVPGVGLGPDPVTNEFLDAPLGAPIDGAQPYGQFVSFNKPESVQDASDTEDVVLDPDGTFDARLLKDEPFATQADYRSERDGPLVADEAGLLITSPFHNIPEGTDLSKFDKTGTLLLSAPLPAVAGYGVFEAFKWGGGYAALGATASVLGGIGLRLLMDKITDVKSKELSKTVHAIVALGGMAVGAALGLVLAAKASVAALPVAVTAGVGVGVGYVGRSVYHGWQKIIDRLNFGDRVNKRLPTRRF